MLLLRGKKKKVGMTYPGINLEWKPLLNYQTSGQAELLFRRESKSKIH